MNPAELPDMQRQRLLLLEDLPEDAKLIEREVRKILRDSRDNPADMTE
ncbi:MAG: hypothetical protein KDI79_27980 [Anaerolineae bacterium]|nr:hypothetical protein [Anaerolineae bacterium]